MSFCLYLLPPDQQVSPGAKVALQPLGPFPGRTYDRAPWNLNRKAQPPAQRAAPTYITPTPGSSGAGQLTRRDALLSSGTLQSAAPRVMSGMLIAEQATTDVGFIKSTSEPIPFPFVLTALNWRFNTALVNLTDFAALWLVDNDVAPSQVNPNGVPIIAPPRTFESATTNVRPWRFLETSPQAHTWNMAGELFQCEQPGKRLYLDVFKASAQQVLVELMWSVRELRPPPPPQQGTP